MATILDGRRVASTVREEVRRRVENLRPRGVVPGLAVVLVGDDPASRVYVRNKRRTCEALGIASFSRDLPADTSQERLLAVLRELANDDRVHGILVQLPLPAHIDRNAVIDAIPPHKDVDGFHPYNLGCVLTGRPALTPCTPAGIVRLLDAYDVPLEGRRAVVIGRSVIVGKPAALLLLARHATVTVAHSRTRNLPDLCRQADVLVVAAGKPRLVRGEWVKPGAAVIDVGIHRRAGGGLEGDVAFDEVEPVAGYISPVPGGVGPMTIAMLMRNTVAAAERAASFAPAASSTPTSGGQS